jgi:carbonic anhydrase
MSKVCLCHYPNNSNDYPFDDDIVNNVTDNNLKVYFAPLALKTNSSRNILSKHRPLNYNRNKLNYVFEQVLGYPNSRTFNILNNSQNCSNDHKMPGNIFRLNGKVFELAEFHFHDKGENIIDNNQGVAEVHFVFGEKNNNQNNNNNDSDSPLNNAVLAFLFKEDKQSHKMITRLLNNEPFKIPVIESYFTYSGSLTKPNPSDIPQLAVCWNISTQYLSITRDDLLALRANFSRFSAEPQPSNGRNIVLIRN